MKSFAIGLVILVGALILIPLTGGVELTGMAIGPWGIQTAFIMIAMLLVLVLAFSKME